MTAYATPPTGPELRLVGPAHIPSVEHPAATALSQVLCELADLVADRVAARLAQPQQPSGDRWFDTRGAAEYLGIGRDSLRRLAADRSIPAEQAGENCKLYFRRADLDEWRRGGSAPAAFRMAA